MEPRFARRRAKRAGEKNNAQSEPARSPTLPQRKDQHDQIDFVLLRRYQLDDRVEFLTNVAELY